MGAAFNVNATAIVINRTGLLFVGPSGWGKSMLAFTCITEAKRMGLAALLVADDQVFLSKRDGEIVAECPPAISGLIELRGTGIVKCESAPLAPMHYAVLPGSASGENRLPPDNDIAHFAEDFSLPALRLLANATVPLAILMAKAPDIGR
ncbi:HPr kinase/phosphorylase [Rhizobium sullae]|uniref:HPr kinase/phosphorylase n=1 Tax=Rhizobium sullae TaxID=50338 RepID=UPI000B35B214|nr:serine/threonine protein kinase [Rhizobium sullae]